ncbi:MAG: hypothetical protein LIP04_16165 [Tannerellaceae bacterium]|nr:hypothetical protein [Tannerellaceae bacterium]
MEIIDFLEWQQREWDDENDGEFIWNEHDIDSEIDEEEKITEPEYIGKTLFEIYQEFPFIKDGTNNQYQSCDLGRSKEVVIDIEDGSLYLMFYNNICERALYYSNSSRAREIIRKLNHIKRLVYQEIFQKKVSPNELFNFKLDSYLSTFDYTEQIYPRETFGL